MKNTVISLILLICISLCLSITGHAVSDKGTESNPFRITNEEELLLLTDFPECYFELENDIEITDTWTPVTEFLGSLDGKGHTITVSKYLSNMHGFFKSLNGSVKNLTINSKSLQLTSRTNSGILAGECSGTIKNCKIIGNATLFSSSSYASTGSIGGVCGYLTSEGMIENTAIQLEYLNVKGDRNTHIYAGGICAKNNGTINQCANLNSTVTLTAYNPGYTTVGQVYYSGISQSNTGIIDCCLSLETIGGNTTKETYYAGICLTNTNGKISDSYSSFNVLKNINRYGIARFGIVENCFFDNTYIESSYTSLGSAKSTLAMKMEVTYKDWDFENVWAIDESEENPINDGYPYLRVFYEDFVAPVTVSTVSAENGKLIIDAKITDISDDYTLHVALYNAQNVLCDYLAIPNERQLKDVFVVYPDNGNAAYAKIFTWYSTDNIEPVSVCETVTIDR